MSNNMTMDEFREKFNTEEACLKFLEDTVWAGGRYCSRCVSTDTVALNGHAAERHLYWRRDCHAQFSITSQTWLHSRKLPLVKYFEIIYYDFNSSFGMASTRIASWTGVSQKSVWKILRAFRELQGFWNAVGEKLAGMVEFDGKWIGGKPRKKKGIKHKRGKGTDKQACFVAVERKEGVRATIVPDDNQATIEPIVEALVEKSAHIMSDEDKVYAKIARKFFLHSTINYGDGEFARGYVHNNTAESFNAFIEHKRDVHFFISKPHMQRYVNDVMSRWNLRDAVEEEMTDREIEKMKRKMSSLERFSYKIFSIKDKKRPTKIVMERMPLLKRLGIVFKHTIGCNVRRHRKTGGIVVLKPA